MRKQGLVMASYVAVAALAAGCSTHGAHRPADTSGSASSGGRPVAAIIECFRAHGAPDFPAPVYDPGDGRWHLAISPASVPSGTRQACQNLLPVAVPSPALPQAAFQQLVRFAQCMRRHGVPDWPDPSPDGAFHLDARLWALGKHGGVNQATQACHVPAGGLNVVDGA
jgi:hypothetical protein